MYKMKQLDANIQFSTACSGRVTFVIGLWYKSTNTRHITKNTCNRKTTSQYW